MKILQTAARMATALEMGHAGRGQVWKPGGGGRVWGDWFVTDFL